MFQTLIDRKKEIITILLVQQNDFKDSDEWVEIEDELVEIEEDVRMIKFIEIKLVKIV